MLTWDLIVDTRLVGLTTVISRSAFINIFASVFLKGQSGITKDKGAFSKCPIDQDNG